jgi:hypothetical protein
MAASCSTLLTKAEFDAYKLSTNLRLKALEDEIKTTLKKGQESKIAETGLKNPSIIAFLLGALGFDSMKNQLNNLLKADDARAKEFERLAEKQEFIRREQEKALTEEARKRLQEQERLDKIVNKADADNRRLENEFKAEQANRTQDRINNDRLSQRVGNAEKLASSASADAKGALGKAGDALGKANKALSELPGIKQLAQLARSDAAQALFKVLGLVGIVFSIFDLLNTFATFESVNAALDTADIARSTANQAYTEAINAKSQARNAQERAALADAKSSRAVSEAQAATNRATDAINKAGVAEAKAINATNAANRANEKSDEALAIGNDNKSQISDLKSQLRGLVGGIEKIRSQLEDLAAVQSLQSVQLKQALNELYRLETLVAVLEGEIEALGEPSLDTVRINALNALITEARDTATKAFQLAERGIQLAANKGAGEFAAQLQSQLTTLRTNFENQTRTTTIQINQLDSRVTQLQENAPEQQRLSQPQIEQVKQIADNEIKVLTPQIVKENTVKPDELDKLLKHNNDSLINFLVPALTIALLPKILPKLDQINSTTTNLQNNPKSPCLAPVYVPPVGAKVQQNITLTNSLQGVTIAQGEATRTTVNAVSTTVNAVSTTVNTIDTKLGAQLKGGIGGRVIGMYDRLNSSKAMQYVMLAIVINNALMLGGNIAQTIGYVMDAIVSLTPFKSFKDANDNEISFNQLFGNTIEGLFAKMFLLCGFIKLQLICYLR